jgi:hypothetical protein
LINNRVAKIRENKRKTIVQESSSPIAESALKAYEELLHPLTIIKRIVYKPYLGHWYPYLDIYSPGYWSQLSFLYGKVSIHISNVRRCSRCLGNLGGDGVLTEEIPIALCKSCSNTVYYGYYRCLSNILKRALAENKTSQTQGRNKSERLDRNRIDGNLISTVVCRDLLNPDCGAMVDLERINPCLKNHGIGLILYNQNKIGVLIGTIESIRYQMIWKGGIYGVLLGYSNKIMNLELLEKEMNSVTQALKAVFSNYSKISNIGSPEIIPAMVYDDFHLLDKTKLDLGILQILVNFFNFYPDYNSKKIVRYILMRCIEIVEAIGGQVLSKLESSIEILDIIEIFKIQNPLHVELRGFLENIMKKEFLNSDVDQMELVTEGRLMNIMPSISRIIVRKIQSFRYPIESLVRRIRDELGLVQTDQLRGGLEIQEVLGSFGSFLIVKGDFSEKLSLIQIGELIGQEIIWINEKNGIIESEEDD